jgi:hypothetical protein
MGKIPREYRHQCEGCTHSCEAETLAGCAEEDRSGAEGAMGEGEGGEDSDLTRQSNLFPRISTHSCPSVAKVMMQGR